MSHRSPSDDIPLETSPDGTCKLGNLSAEPLYFQRRVTVTLDYEATAEEP